MIQSSNSKRLLPMPRPRVEFTPGRAKFVTVVSGAATVVHLLLRQRDVVQPHGFLPRKVVV
jgi:hypothetical protein